MTMQERQLIEEYEINPCTIAVIPVKYGCKIYSQVLELEDECISPFKPMDIIKESCEFFGATYEGRKNGTKKLIGAIHKVPIAISPTNSIYFFPTTSPENSNCVWIAFEHVVDYKKGENNSTIVTFKNGQTLELPISPSSFQNQMIRTVMLKSKLSQRIEESRQKAAYMNQNKGKLIEASEKVGEFRYMSRRKSDFS